MNKNSLFELAFNEEQRAAIAEIVGPEHVACVEDAALVYVVKERFYRNRPSIPKLNEALVEVREHVAAITELLSDNQLRDYVLAKALADFGAEGRRKLTGKAVPFVNRTPGLIVIDALKDLDSVCGAAIKKQKPGRGHPNGARDEAINHLVNELYRCCKSANGGRPLTTKPRNMLQRLVDILNKPLGLGGSLGGIVRRVIETRK